jgi:hypothetical protein
MGLFVTARLAPKWSLMASAMGTAVLPTYPLSSADLERSMSQAREHSCTPQRVENKLWSRAGQQHVSGIAD